MFFYCGFDGSNACEIYEKTRQFNVPGLGFFGSCTAIFSDLIKHKKARLSYQKTINKASKYR